MRGKDEQKLDVFSYISPEPRVPRDHPLRLLRAMTDEALQELKPQFDKLYAKTGRPSTKPARWQSRFVTIMAFGCSLVFAVTPQSVE
jgi:hypothetical protein